MKQINNNFIFFGAIHQDFVFELKNDLIKYRTNPIKHSESYGGVAHNVARVISKNENVSLCSIKSDRETIRYLKKIGINFVSLNNKIQKRYYGILINKFKKFQLGIANTEAYELFKKTIINFQFKNKYLIFDLNFSNIFIKNIINKYYKNNKIIICGTSPFKVHKIKNLLKKINCLILNKEELFTLTNIRNINKSIKFIISINPNINLIVSNGGNKTYAYEYSKLISIKPPKVKIINENGAGDVMAGNYIYYRSKNYTLEKSLSLGIAMGIMHVKSKKNAKINFKSIKNISNKIKINKEKLYE